MLEKPKRRWYMVDDMLNEICNILYKTNGITEEIMIMIHHNIGQIELLLHIYACQDKQMTA